MKKYNTLVLIVLSWALSCSPEYPNFRGADYKASLTHGKRLKEIRVGDTVVYRFTYDSLNHLIEVNNYKYDTVFTENYEYADNRLIKRIVGDVFETFDYNSKGWIISKTATNDKYNYKAQTIYKYGSSGNIVEAKHLLNGEITNYTHYKYDDAGNTLLRKEILKSGMAWTEHKFTYDHKKNPRRDFTFDFDVVQRNNVTSFAETPPPISSQFGRQYQSSYKYDADGYPIKEFREYPYYSDIFAPNKVYTLDYIYE